MAPNDNLARLLDVGDASRGADAGDASPAPAVVEFKPLTAHDLDVVTLQTMLKSAIATPLVAKADAKPKSADPIAVPAPKPEMLKPWMRRALKAGIALALVAIVGWEPLKILVAPASVEAVVNARLVTLKSPIAGEVASDQLPQPGNELASGASVLHVINPRAERGKLDDLERSLAELVNTRPALAAKLDWARAHRLDLSAQTEAFAEARIREREAKKAELESELAVADARNAEAQSALTRATKLAAKGTIPAAELDRQTRDAAVAQAGVTLAGNRIATLAVELDALRAGSFVGDSYNDRPSTAQMADEMAVRISDLEAELSTLDGRAKSIAAELEQEQQHFAQVSRFDLKAPGKGRVWEVMTAPGEQVAPGQDLVKVLDCSGALVTASVSESVYNHLNVGMPAMFRLRDGSHEYAGEIVNLTGVAQAAANFAIEPALLMKEPYRVTVKVPGIGQGADCNIGRTGRVYFNERPEDQGFSFARFLR